jgi:acetate kinase
MWIFGSLSMNRTDGVSWAKPRHGREVVAAFFEELREELRLHMMEALEITAVGDRVVEGGIEGLAVYRAEL